MMKYSYKVKALFLSQLEECLNSEIVLSYILATFEDLADGEGSFILEKQLYSKIGMKSMLRKEIFISYKLIISVILIVISIVITIINAVLLYKYNNATDYKDSSLESGDYVVCKIENYLVKPIDKYSSNVYSGQCEVDSTFFKDYYVYNIPYANGMYVRVKIYDKDMEKQLEGKSTLKEKNISIVGKVISEDDISKEWYECIPDFSISKLKKGICIKEINYKQYENLTMLGGMTLIISVFILLREVKENKKYTVLY